MFGLGKDKIECPTGLGWEPSCGPGVARPAGWSSPVPPYSLSQGDNQGIPIMSSIKLKEERA